MDSRGSRIAQQGDEDPERLMKKRKSTPHTVLSLRWTNPGSRDLVEKRQ